MARAFVTDQDPGDETPAQTVEQAELFHWRFERAVELGFDLDAALQLAGNSTDLHDVEKLLKSGCRHDLAARIAWPMTP